MPSGTIEDEEKIAFSASDDWDLIKIIAQFISKDPRYSIKELIDNALDAFSRVPYLSTDKKVVNVLIRKKDKHNPYIKIFDNGPGWEPHKDPANPKYGMPDFECTIKHIGDSIKKKRAEFNKAREEGRAVGQYAIGLFSFWALGGRLTVYSRSALEGRKIGPCSQMVWHKEIKDAVIKHGVEPPAELSEEPGSVLVIDQLEKAQMNLITGNILEKYLSRACRTVLMKSGIELVIDDHGTKLVVKPKKYEGTKFHIMERETDGFGPISLEIYAFPPVESEDEYRVPVFCKGAKGYDDITELPELNIYPWNAKKVYGEVNYPFATLSPSRTGFVNDAFLDAFIKNMCSVTAQLGEFVDNIEARKKARQKDKFYEIFRETWQDIFKKLPEEWLRKDGLILTPTPHPPPPPETGPMYRIEISPDGPKVACRTVESLTARPYDINGNIIHDPSLIYYWKLTGKPLGLLKDEMKKTCHFQAGNLEGITTLTVTVLQFIEDAGKEKTITKTVGTNLWVVRELPSKRPPLPPTGDRPPSLEERNLSEDGPHSKYMPQTKMVEVNDHHKDYIKAKEHSDETLYRYINYCYAKEIAVDRMKSLDSHELSEKITDLVSISERLFDWKELVKKRRGRHPKEASSYSG